MANKACLFCGLPLDPDSEQNWHKKCILDFFGAPHIPNIDVSQASMEALARSSLSQGLSVPGVQKKISLGYREKKKTQLTVMNYPTGYILKPQSSDYGFLPEAEQLGMTLADIAGIPTVPHALVFLKDGSLAYLTKRIDRISVKGKTIKIPMEDFCQLSGNLSEDKYRGSYENCAKVIRRYSSFFMGDETEFFYRLVFCFVIGNSDMHLKNFSLISQNEMEYHLSPAYDLLPVNIVMPTDTEETALTLNGKKRHLHKKDFLTFAATIGIPENAAHALIQKQIANESRYQEFIRDSFLPKDWKNRFSFLVSERILRLK